MRYNWGFIKNKFEMLKMSERLLIVGAIAGLSYMLLSLLVIQPDARMLDGLLAKEEVINKDIKLAEVEIAVFESAIINDPNLALKKELNGLRAKLEVLDKSLTSFSLGLISADNLPMMLHDVLKKNQKLKLLNMLTLPSKEIQLGAVEERQQTLNRSADNLNNKVLAQAIKDSDAARREAQALAESPAEERALQSVRLYKHGVHLSFSGSYKDVVAYIASLESDKWRFYWDALSYSVESYPMAEISLQVYTLSSERGAFDGS